jgi:thiol:disulfide interchange protein DsbD
MPGKTLLPLLVLTGLALVACGPAGEEEAAAPSSDERVAVTATPVGTAAGGVTILWEFALAEGWHLYAPLRNDSGFPPRIKLTLPEGWGAGSLQWPAPERYLAAGDILDHVYHERLALLQDLTLPASAESGQAFSIGARLDWLICKDACVPGHRELDLTVTVGDTTTAQALADRLAGVRAALPVPAPRSGYSLTWHDAAVEIAVPGAVALAFYPAEDCAPLADVIGDAVGDTDRLTLDLRARDGGYGPLKGILHQKLPGGRSRNWTIDQPHGG